MVVGSLGKDDMVVGILGKDDMVVGSLGIVSIISKHSHMALSAATTALIKQKEPSTPISASTHQ